MTLQDLFALIVEYRSAVLLTLFFAPWLALGLCIVIPGRREEPFVLSFNLAMACLSLLLAAGYLVYAIGTGGWSRVIQEADILLMLAPCYYVGVSIWVTKQRLPLDQVPAFRAIQGLALIGVGYLGLSWFLGNVRFLVFSYLPFQGLVLLLLGLLGIGYFGYLRLTGKDIRTPGTDRDLDDELDDLRRRINNKKS